jgi:hypothetical protein
VKISTKSLFGASALAAALVIAPAAFAGPCNSESMQGSSAANAENEQGGGMSMADYDALLQRNSRYTHEANRALAHDPELRDQDIGAWVEPGGFVVLRGAVDSPADAIRAMRVVANATGLRKFDDEMFYPGTNGEGMASTGNEAGGQAMPMSAPEAARQSMSAPDEQQQGANEPQHHNHSWTQASRSNQSANTPSASSQSNTPNDSAASSNENSSQNDESSSGTSGTSQSDKSGNSASQSDND